MRKASGRAIGQLLGPERDNVSREVPVGDIIPNKRQPRQVFDNDPLEELAESIKVHGILSPLLVRPLSGGKYELIAGERRLRAAKLAGLRTVPVTVRSVAGQESLELAIIENVQRQDISAYEAAVAYKQLIDEFGLNQEDVALRVGKTRTAISNSIRLLRLPQRVLDGLLSGEISEGHARALLAANSPEKQLAIYDRILKDSLTVRDVEKLAAEKGEDKPKPAVQRVDKDIHTKQLEGALSERLGLPARINRKGEQGVLEIAIYSDDDLQKILDLLGVEL